MQSRFTQLIFILLLIVTTGCEVSAIEAGEDLVVDRPIVPEARSELVGFTSGTVKTRDAELTNLGTMFWDLKHQRVLDGDVVKKLVSCDHEELAVCYLQPFPVLVPKVIHQKSVYSVQGEDYVLTIDALSQRLNACELDSLKVSVESEDQNSYVYVISRTVGLLYFSVISSDGEADREMYRHSGTVMSYDDECQRLE